MLGSPSARERTIEAAHLLDQGFAQWGGGQGALQDLPASSTLTAPDMRPDICSRRNRAAIAAAEEEDIAPVMTRGSGRSVAMTAVAAPSPTLTAETVAEPVHFDPVPIFIGPKPGWTGPVLAARPSGAAPADGSAPTASAYAGEKPLALGGADPQSAPMALQGALRPTKSDKNAAAVTLVGPQTRPKIGVGAKTIVHAKLIAKTAKKKINDPVVAPTP